MYVPFVRVPYDENKICRND